MNFRALVFAAPTCRLTSLAARLTLFLAYQSRFSDSTHQSIWSLNRKKESGFPSHVGTKRSVSIPGGPPPACIPPRHRRDTRRRSPSSMYTWEASKISLPLSVTLQQLPCVSCWMNSHHCCLERLWNALLRSEATTAPIMSTSGCTDDTTILAVVFIPAT